MAIQDTEIPDTSVFLDDPQRKPLEIDTEEGSQGVLMDNAGPGTHDCGPPG